MCERVSVAEAAKELGCAQQAVREQMKRGTWNLGYVVQTGKSGRKYAYYIYREKLNKHLGRTS